MPVVAYVLRSGAVTLAPVELWEAAGLALAGFGAGAVNAMAGGGTLIAFPAVLALGYGSTLANVTSKIAIWPGTIGGSWAYRGEISRQRRTILLLLIPTAVGSIAGSALLLWTPESVFDRVVPFLILGACALLVLQDRLIAMFFKGERSLDIGLGRILLQIGMFAVAVYGGYFGAAFGIIVLAFFGMLLPEDIQHANALKGLVAFFVNGLSIAYFAVLVDVAWDAVAIMAAFAFIGGYLGVAAARRLPRARLRYLAAAYGTVAALYMLLA
jgi:uncharacterized membrane protein YfcA